MVIPFNSFLKSINEREFGVIYFRDTEHHPGSPPHNYIIVPTEPPYCITVCLITSQIAKRKEYHKGRPTLTSLVELDVAPFSFITKPSIIDCNYAEMINKASLETRIDKSRTYEMRIRDKDFPDKHKSPILQAINNSPIVKPFIKRSLIFPTKK